MESVDMGAHVYKVDKFIVPDTARSEFVPVVAKIMALLKTQPGHVRSFILEQPGTQGSFHLVTLAEWETKQATENARTLVAAMQRESGINPQELMVRLGIQADMSIYTAVNS